MYYCTTTRQKTGDFTRCVSTYQKHASTVSTAHHTLRTNLSTLNGSYVVGSEELVSITELDDRSNTGDLTSNPLVTGTVTICNVSGSVYRYASIDLRGVSLSALATHIRNHYLELTGIDLLTPASRNNCYITNAVFYMYESEASA